MFSQFSRRELTLMAALAALSLLSVAAFYHFIDHAGPPEETRHVVPRP